MRTFFIFSFFVFIQNIVLADIRKEEMITTLYFADSSQTHVIGRVLKNDSYRHYYRCNFQTNPELSLSLCSFTFSYDVEELKGLTQKKIPRERKSPMAQLTYSATGTGIGALASAWLVAQATRVGGALTFIRSWPGTAQVFLPVLASVGTGYAGFKISAVGEKTPLTDLELEAIHQTINLDSFRAISGGTYATRLSTAEFQRYIDIVESILK